MTSPICPVCQLPFAPKRVSHVICSPGCRRDKHAAMARVRVGRPREGDLELLARIKAMIQQSPPPQKPKVERRRCLHCPTLFEPKRADHKFCSSHCQKTYNNKLRIVEQPSRKLMRGTWNLDACPYAAGAVKMPDGGREPSRELGF